MIFMLNLEFRDVLGAGGMEIHQTRTSGGGHLAQEPFFGSDRRPQPVAGRRHACVVGRGQHPVALFWHKCRSLVFRARINRSGFL